MQHVGPFELVRQLGQGGQASVWEAIDTRDQTRVALKLIPSGDATGEARLIREAALLRALRDPGVPDGFELVRDASTRAIGVAMDLIDAPSLADVMRREVFDVADVVALATELARILGVVHVHGVAHRDVKPANVLLRPSWRDGRTGGVVLVDFGIARGSELHATHYTEAGCEVGTLPFMAPELLTGRAPGVTDATLDVYAFGVLIWLLLFGEHPSGLPMSAPESSFLQAQLSASGEPRLPAYATDEILKSGIINVLNLCLVADPARRLCNGHAAHRALVSLGFSRPRAPSAAPKQTAIVAPSTPGAVPSTPGGRMTAGATRVLGVPTPSPAGVVDAASAPTVVLRRPEPPTRQWAAPDPNLWGQSVALGAVILFNLGAIVMLLLGAAFLLR